MEYELSNKMIILFGMGPAGLFLSRQLFRVGYQIIGIGKEDDIGRYSNTLHSYYATENIEKIKTIVTEICEPHPGTKGYICSDQYLTMFLEEWPEIFSLISFSEPGKEMLEMIADKERIIGYCKEIGVRFPEIYTDAENEENVCFPVAIKPNVKRGYSPIPKVSILSDHDQLVRFLRDAEKKGLKKNELIIQQYIPGDNRFEYGYGGYFREGIQIVDVAFIQARQYPQGVSCYTYEVSDDNEYRKIKDLVKPFVQETHYSGFLQFDIKKHPSTGEFYVLDINPRPWGSVSILTPKCCTSSIFAEEYVPDIVLGRWRFPFKEVVSFKNKKNIPYNQIRELLPGEYVTIVDLYDKNDRKPFFMQVSIAATKIIKKVKRRK